MNDLNPELNGKYLGTISQDFIKIADIIKESSYQVRVRKFSDYPIFPISKTDIPIGKLLLSKEDLNLEWHYYITYLDEFVQRKLIEEDNVEEFKRNYKDPEEFACLFVVDKKFTNYLYIPYPVD